jgi:hypothetical protein
VHWSAEETRWTIRGYSLFRAAATMSGSLPMSAVHRDGKETIMAQLPRYVRINVLKITLGAAERALKQTGHVRIVADNRNNRYRRRKPDKKVNHRGYTRDPHIRELLCFQPKGKSDLSRIPLVLDGSLVVQQKASCFPALALAPPRGAHVIDACAAPGTSTVFFSRPPQLPPCIGWLSTVPFGWVYCLQGV